MDHKHKENKSFGIGTADIKKCWICLNIKKEYKRLDNVFHYTDITLPKRKLIDKEICCKCYDENFKENK